MESSAQNLLDILEATGLVRMAQLEPDLEYLFRHALVQEAAYSSVLRTDRKALHALVGKTLEGLYADRASEFSAILGHHFAEAGENEKAIQYLKLAGENAARQYALNEALGHFSRALELKPDPEIHSARGRVHATLGEFERARADFEMAAAELHKAKDLKGECRALLDLGALWAERDYQYTGKYFQDAYQLAVEAGDLAMQANALNRIGNWYINQDKPVDAAARHDQALAIFEQSGDERGIAETHDLLGMTNAIAGNAHKAVAHYTKAIAMFRTMGEVTLLASSLSAIQLAAPSVETDTVVCPFEFQQAVNYGWEAARLAQSIHWLSGEVFAYFCIGQIASYSGEYTIGWDTAHRAMEIAQSIQHDQWILATHIDFGDWHRSLLDYDRAAEEFEQAYALAKQIGSLHWVRTAGGILASTYALSGRPTEAQTLLADLMLSADPPTSLGQRQVWFAKADLLLAQKELTAVFDLIALLEQTGVPDERGDIPAIRLEMLRAQALILSETWGEAEKRLDRLISYLQRVNILPVLWRAHRLLSTVYLATGRSAEASAATESMREILKTLLTKIPQPYQDIFASHPDVAPVLADSKPSGSL